MDNDAHVVSSMSYFVCVCVVFLRVGVLSVCRFRNLSAGNVHLTGCTYDVVAH